MGDTTKHKKQTFIYKRKINNFTLDLLCQALKSTSWECILNCKDVNDAYELFLNIFKEKLNEAIPLIKLKFKTRIEDKPRISRTLKNSIRRKNQLYQVFLYKKSSDAEHKYKKTKIS